jgi:hypothetical protein
MKRQSVQTAFDRNDNHMDKDKLNLFNNTFKQEMLSKNKTLISILSSKTSLCKDTKSNIIVTLLKR